jgi:hypothetical protein
MKKAFGLIFLVGLLACSQTSVKYTKSDILRDFDSNGGMENPYKFILVLEDGYLNVSSNKIHLYADKDRWAVVFEKNGYNGHNYVIEKVLCYFGNCLINQDRAGLNGKYLSNMKIFYLSTQEDLKEVYGKISDVNPKAGTIKIRDKDLPIECDPEVYAKNNMPWRKYDTGKKEIDLASLTRLLNVQYPEVFNSTEYELRTCLPKDLPEIMTIDEWYHVDCYNVPAYSGKFTLPSSVETFQLIADVLVTKDKSKFRPTKKSNSDWRNWKSGEL